ncbi:MAG: hypothetical protein ABIW79_00700 [Gemmatimonas sp.]
MRVEDASGGREDADAKIELDGESLIVRGAARTRVARSDITNVAVQNGVLLVTHAGGLVHLSLADAAEKWKARILEGPKSRVQKLGVKAGMRVTLVEVNDPTVGRECADAGATLVDDGLRDAAVPVDLLLTEVRTKPDLARIPRLAQDIGHGALWVIHPNGVAEVSDTAIFAVAATVNMVATKTMSFSTGMSAERLSIRKR